MSLRKPIICILGNSVSLLVQPFRKNADEKTYGEHLVDEGFTVMNSSKQAVVLPEVYRYLEDECIRYFPDYVIINFGIVEATRRARPRWLQHMFSMNAWNNSIINKGYNGPYLRGLKFVTKKLYRMCIERPLYACGLSWRWVSPSTFSFALIDIVKRIFSDTPVKKILILGMLPVADWVEQQAPGTRSSIKVFNQCMRDCASMYSRNIVYIDPQQLIPSGNLAEISADGIHFNAEGHRRLATLLQGLLNGERSEYSDWTKMNQYKKLYSLYEHWNKRKTSNGE